MFSFGVCFCIYILLVRFAENFSNIFIRSYSVVGEGVCILCGVLCVLHVPRQFMEIYFLSTRCSVARYNKSKTDLWFIVDKLSSGYSYPYIRPTSRLSRTSTAHSRNYNRLNPQSNPAVYIC